MKFISTRGNSEPVSFLEAARKGLAPDGGLYMPASIPELPAALWSSLHRLSFTEIAFELAKPFLKEEISDSAIRDIAESAFNFPVVLKNVEEDFQVLELFHGPTMAFKDFGARFMARLFSHRADQQQGEVTILVATSGDTGSAVANGFYDVEGVRVCLLYPAGKVSPLQEKQMTTLGGNITAVEVDGVFDDCQRLVKQAFRDPELTQKMQLSSANSINIARLLPQSFYYAFAVGELQKKGQEAPVFSVPSGNFGNLTAGLIAQKMGLKVPHFLAATNRNNVVPNYLNGSAFQPKPSVPTISNAMDVGNPSNFDRMLHLFGQSDESLRRSVSGTFYSDEDTRETILGVYEQTGYLPDPHTAVGYRAAKDFRKKSGKSGSFVVLGTAHPAKFREVIKTATGSEPEIPPRLQSSLLAEKKSIPAGKEFSDFKSLLLNL